MKCTLELFEEYEKINFYTIRIDDADLTEAERFLDKFPIGSDYDEDVDVIIAWLEKISENGALKRYFRPEGLYGDGVGAIPIDVGHNVRLYCLRLSDGILIISNGDVKNVERWQDSEILKPIVELLISMSSQIEHRRRNGTIAISDKVINGNLEFEI